MEEGGVESVVLNLNRMLARAGHESFVVSRGGRLVPRIEVDGGRHLALDLKSKNPLTFFLRAAKLRRALDGLSPDLVCAHSRVPAWLFVQAKGRMRRQPKWITYAHGANSISRYSAVMTRGDLIVVPSRFLAEYLTGGYGRDFEAKIRVVPNAVDLDRFDPAKLDRAFMDEKRREWKLAPGERVTMAVGRITPLKGYDAVIDDFAARGSGKLVIVGGADAGKRKLLEALEALARRRGVASRVVFAGPQTKIPECLALADEIVSGNTTKPESFGLSVAEAYAMNRPVRVLRRFGGVAEIMAAVESSARPTFREAVTELYDFDIISRRTLEVYKELTQ